MARNAIYTVQYRRKREGKTNYKKRLELLKSGQNRLVIRRSNTSITIQFVQYVPDGDKVLMTFNSNQLESFGWKYSKKSLPAAYLAGLAAGKQMIDAGHTQAILDLGLQTPLKGSKLYSALKGVIDAGVSIPSSDHVFPSEERLTGQHIAQYSDLASSASAYKKAGLNPADIPKAVQAVKEKIQN